VLQSRIRACLEATRDSDALLRDALGAKKLKNCAPAPSAGRTRRRAFRGGADTRRRCACDRDILTLEASGWKASAEHRRWCSTTATPVSYGAHRVVAEASCEIVSLRARYPGAAAIVLRHQDRAFYFKLGIDERFANFRPAAVDARSDRIFAPIRKSQRLIHRGRRSSDDQSDLARGALQSAMCWFRCGAAIRRPAIPAALMLRRLATSRCAALFISSAGNERILRVTRPLARFHFRRDLADGARQ